MACEATRQETDAGPLVPMIQQGRENLGVAASETLTVADAGYGGGADLQAAEHHAMNVLVPPAEGRNDPKNLYAAQYFHYDAATAAVTCPQGRQLDYQGPTFKQGVRIERYRCHAQDCPVRAQCSGDPKGRSYEVRPYTPQVQAMRARLAEPEARAQWVRRRTIIEPRFGQLKQHDGFRRWTVWGLEAVRTQWALLCATLNLRVLYRRWRHGRGPEAASAAAVGLRLQSIGRAVAGHLIFLGWRTQGLASGRKRSTDPLSLAA